MFSRMIALGLLNAPSEVLSLSFGFSLSLLKPLVSATVSFSLVVPFVFAGTVVTISLVPWDFFVVVPASATMRCGFTSRGVVPAPSAISISIAPVPPLTLYTMFVMVPSGHPLVVVALMGFLFLYLTSST